MPGFLAPEQLTEAEAKAIALVDKAFAARGRMGPHLHNLENMRATVRYTFASLKAEIAKGTLVSTEQMTESLAQRMRQSVEEIERERAESLAGHETERGRKDQEQFYDMQRAECYVVMNSIAESLGIRQSFQALCSTLAPAGAAR